jgi:hypothetical protein
MDIIFSTPAKRAPSRSKGRLGNTFVLISP